MLALVFATLAVVAPDGWIEAPGGHAASGVQDLRYYHPPGEPSTFYLVFKTSRDSAAMSLSSLRMPGGVGHQVSATSERVNGRLIEDTRFEREDGTHTHIRTLTGTQPSTLVGICHGKVAAFEACESKIALLSVEVEELDTEYFGRIALWLLLGALALGAVGGLVLALIKKWRLAASPKLVEGERLTVSGVVKAIGTSFEAPLSGRRCVVHRSHARIVVKDELVAEPAEQQIGPFEIETKHGLVRIDVAGLELAALPEAVVDKQTDRQRAFRERHGVPDAASIAYAETVIEPGAKVSIKGIVALERDPSATAERGYRDDAPSTIRLVAAPSKPVTVTKIW